MIKMFPHLDESAQATSLQALLSISDREIAHSLALDSAALKERASQNLKRKRQHISFILGNNEMALSIESIQEIGYLPTIIPLPNLPHWIKGIVQIRGEILSAIDLLSLFGIINDIPPLKPSYVLFRKKDLKYCIMTNKITGVISIDEDYEYSDKFTKEELDKFSTFKTLLKGKHITNQRTIFVFDENLISSFAPINNWTSSQKSGSIVK